MTGRRRARTLGCLGATALLLHGPAFAAAPKGDPAQGRALYAQCLACHTLAENSVGPKHCGLFGRRAGTVPGFDYSPAMRNSGIVWNAKTLDRFLADPQKAVPGTAMPFAGIADAAERADLIAYLRDATAPARCAESGGAPAR